MSQGDGLTADELASIRDASEAWMPDTAYIMSNAGTVSRIGGRTQSFGTIGTVAARFRQGFGAHSTDGERQSAVVTDSEWEIVVPSDAGVTTQHVLKRASTGVTYSVTGTNADRSNAADQRCSAVRRD